MFIPLQDIIYHTNILTICVQFLHPNSAAVVITGEVEDLSISNIMLYSRTSLARTQRDCQNVFELSEV